MSMRASTSRTIADPKCLVLDAGSTSVEPSDRDPVRLDPDRCPPQGGQGRASRRLLTSRQAGWATLESEWWSRAGGASSTISGKLRSTAWKIRRRWWCSCRGLPRRRPASWGTRTARGEAAGTLHAIQVVTNGRTRSLQAMAGPVPLGNLAFR